VKNVPTSLCSHFSKNLPLDCRDLDQLIASPLSAPHSLHPLDLSTANTQAMTNHRELNVRPIGTDPWTSDDIIQLSDLDHLMPKLYVHMIEIFELPENSIKDSIVKNLVSGLERALADYPILTGQLDSLKCNLYTILTEN
jgi:hypothetical protein